MAKVVIMGARAKEMIIFRGDLILDLVAAGHEVYSLAGEGDEMMKERIESLGAKFISYPIMRNQVNVVKDLETVSYLKKIIGQIAPDVVLAYNIKPVIWGSFAVDKSKSVKYYALIEGLGFAFYQGGFKRALLRLVAVLLYRLAMYKTDQAIFLNKDNLDVFIKEKIVPARKCSMVDGIGVDLEHFRQVPVTSSPFVFLTIARLLGEKGLREYFEAACIVKKKYPEVQFNILGQFDTSHDGIPEAEVDMWRASGAMNYLGTAEDVRPYLEKASVYVLPSYHEGLPRSTQEAMSMGRPVLTTDVPGCRQTVENGENGFMVEVKNVDALVERMFWFIEHPDMLGHMGAKSREIAEARFDVKKINAKIIGMMGLQQGVRPH